MDSADKKLPVPPYVAYKTLRNFLERFKQGVPGRIDRGLMASMSGAAQSQVTTALRYLGFISENGIPTESLRQYVSGEEEGRREALRRVLEISYPFVFGREASFDFSTATSSQLREEFEARTSATGETVGRCIAFLKDAAQDAGIIISPYIMQKSAARPARKRNGRKEESKETKAKPKEQEHHSSPSGDHVSAPIAAQQSLLLWGLFQRLPQPGSVWPRDQRDQWTQTLNNVLALEYRDE